MANYEPQTLQKAKDRIMFLLRQADGEKLPYRMPASDYIRELVDEETAQKLYEEIISEIEKVNGTKIERF